MIASKIPSWSIVCRYFGAWFLTSEKRVLIFCVLVAVFRRAMPRLWCKKQRSPFGSVSTSTGSRAVCAYYGHILGQNLSLPLTTAAWKMYLRQKRAQVAKLAKTRFRSVLTYTPPNVEKYFFAFQYAPRFYNVHWWNAKPKESSEKQKTRSSCVEHRKRSCVADFWRQVSESHIWLLLTFVPDVDIMPRVVFFHSHPKPGHT